MKLVGTGGTAVEAGRIAETETTATPVIAATHGIVTGMAVTAVARVAATAAMAVTATAERKLIDELADGATTGDVATGTGAQAEATAATAATVAMAATAVPTLGAVAEEASEAAIAEVTTAMFEPTGPAIVEVTIVEATEPTLLEATVATVGATMASHGARATAVAARTPDAVAAVAVATLVAKTSSGHASGPCSVSLLLLLLLLFLLLFDDGLWLYADCLLLIASASNYTVIIWPIQKLLLLNLLLHLLMRRGSRPIIKRLLISRYY